MTPWKTGGGVNLGMNAIEIYLLAVKCFPEGEKDRQVNHLEMIALDCARAQHG